MLRLKELRLLSNSRTLGFLTRREKVPDMSLGVCRTRSLRILRCSSVKVKNKLSMRDSGGGLVNIISFPSCELEIGTSFKVVFLQTTIKDSMSGKRMVATFIICSRCLIALKQA